MIKCENYKENISLYLDNKLSPKETEDLKKHLETCSECKEEYIFLKNIKNILAESKVQRKEPSSDFTDSVMNKIKNKTYAENDDNVISIKFLKKHFLVAASFIFIVLSSTILFVRDAKVVKNQMQIPAKHYDTAYDVSIVENYLNDKYAETDIDDLDFEEEYILSLLV